MTSGRGFSEDMRLAHVLADQADSISLDRFRAQDLKVDTKPDLTPVTDADRAVEEQLRITLSRARTRDAVMGEEFGTTGHGPRRWVLDPIDGTKNFVRGVPVWATLISLFDGDEPVVGLVSAPALNKRWWAAKDVGAWTGRRLESATRCRVSEVTDLADASLSYSSLSGWEERGALDGFLDLTRSVWRTRAYGDFWSYCLLAEGAVDIACEPEVSIWDLAALDVIVREAGGRFTDLSGAQGPAGGSALATNGALHDAALAHVRQGAPVNPLASVPPVPPG
jgi:histidinol-phosphatase